MPNDQPTTVHGNTPQVTLSTATDVSDFFIDGIGRQDQEQLLEFYRARNERITKAASFPSNLHLRLEIVRQAGDLNPPEYFPDVIDDVFGQKYYIRDPESYIPEAASYYILLFTLGMISRYYPDVWINNIDANVEMAEITNAFLNLAHRKFPNLILDQLTGVKHVIHN